QFRIAIAPKRIVIRKLRTCREAFPRSLRFGASASGSQRKQVSRFFHRLPLAPLFLIDVFSVYHATHFLCGSDVVHPVTSTTALERKDLLTLRCEVNGS